jgi:hypothetical protein
MLPSSSVRQPSKWNFTDWPTEMDVGRLQNRVVSVPPAELVSMVSSVINVGFSDFMNPPRSQGFVKIFSVNLFFYFYALETEEFEASIKRLSKT